MSTTTNPGTGRLVINRGNVKLGGTKRDPVERYLLVARYKGARLEFRAETLDPLCELVDHMLKLEGCTSCGLSSDLRGRIE